MNNLDVFLGVMPMSVPFKWWFSASSALEILRLIEEASSAMRVKCRVSWMALLSPLVGARRRPGTALTAWPVRKGIDAERS